MPLSISLALRMELGRPLSWEEADNNLSALRSAALGLDSRVSSLEQGIVNGVGTLVGNAMQAHLDSLNPHSQYLLDVPDDGKRYERMHGAWVEAQAAGGGGGSVDLSLRNYTSTATSGTHTKEEIVLSVAPSGNSTAVEIASRITTNASVSSTNQPGSSIGAQQTVVNVQGSGAIDKIVGILSHINLTGSGRRSAVLGYEVGIPTVSGDANVGSVAGFYFPNLEAIPNINRIEVIAAFANQHRKAIIQNMGVYVDSTLRQVVAPEHIGMSANRYYSAPYRWRGYAGTSAGVADLMPIHIPARTTVTEIGVGIESAVAGAKGRMAIYTAERGGLGRRVAQTAELDLSTAGWKAGALNVELDGGMYWCALVTDRAVSATSHSPQDTGGRAAMFGQSDPLATDTNTQRSASINLGAYSASPFPELANIVPTFLAQDGERHMCIRVSGA